MSKINQEFAINQFARTRRDFSEYTGISSPISYEEWSQQSEDMKAALLFVNFYEQITFAWYKSSTEYVYEEDGVDEAINICCKLCGTSLKRLQKDTKSESSMTPDTFQPRYMYRVMKNAFDCLVYTKNGTKTEYHPDDKKNPENNRRVQSQYFVDSSGVEQDMLATINGSKDLLETIENERLWSVMQSEDDNEDVQYIIDRLMRYDERMQEAKNLETLEKVRVSKAKFIERNFDIISDLREKLKDFAPA